MNTNKKLYMLLNLVVSYDNHHVSNNKIHLIGSAFYTNVFNIELLNNKLSRKSVVIRVSNNTSRPLCDATPRWNGAAEAVSINNSNPCMRSDSVTAQNVNLNSFFINKSENLVEFKLGLFELIIFLIRNYNMDIQQLKHTLINEEKLKLLNSTIRRYAVPNANNNAPHAHSLREISGHEKRPKCGRFHI